MAREGIEASELVYKPLESFQGKDVKKEFAEARFRHYDSRRKGIPLSTSFLNALLTYFTGKIKLLREVREAIIQEEDTKKTRSRELTQQNSHQVELESLNITLITLRFYCTISIHLKCNDLKGYDSVES